MKEPMITEVMGEEGRGKSHSGVNGFPEPYVLDLTPDAEAKPIVLKYVGYDESKIETMYKSCKVFNDLRQGLFNAEKSNKKTIIIDSSNFLQGFASNEWCKENKKSTPYASGMTGVNYGQIRDKIDDLCRQCRASGLNMVFTSPMKDEWVDDKCTGKRIPDNYTRLRSQCDFRLQVQVVKDITTKKHVRKFIVLKNRFVDLADPEYVHEIADLTLENLMRTTKYPKAMWNL